MTDLTMCQDAHCPLRENCLRFIAKPSANQSYGNFGKTRIGMGCNYYLPVNEEQE